MLEGVMKGDRFREEAEQLTMILWLWGTYQRFDMFLLGLFSTQFTLETKTDSSVPSNQLRDEEITHISFCNMATGRDDRY